MKNNPMKLIIKFCFCILLFASALHAADYDINAPASSNEMTVIGTGTVVKGNFANAKDQAIINAINKGLEYYLVRKLGKDGVTNNFQRLVQILLPEAKNFVENFHVLVEEILNDELKILVQIKINEILINEKLIASGMVVSPGSAQKVLFMVSEIKNGVTDFWWGTEGNLKPPMNSSELVLNNVFQLWGFTPVNHNVSYPDIPVPGELKVINLEDRQILEWGEMFKADIIMFGQTEFSENNKVSFVLKVFDIKQGKQIAQDIQNDFIKDGAAGQEPVMDSLNRIIEASVHKLLPVIFENAAIANSKTENIEISLSGLKSFKEYRLFRDFLKNSINGVKSIRQTRARINSMSLSVEFNGTKETFVNRVLNSENIPFPLKYEQNAEGEMIFEIIQVLQ